MIKDDKIWRGWYVIVALAIGSVFAVIVLPWL